MRFISLIIRSKILIFTLLTLASCTKSLEGLIDLDVDQKTSENAVPSHFEISTTENRFTSGAPEFSWTPSLNAFQYRVRVSSSDDSCSSNVLQQFFVSSSIQSIVLDESIADGNYFLCVTAVNEAGTSLINANNNGFQFFVDLTVATVTQVALPANGSYGLGHDLDFIVHFNDAVTVSGTPRLVLDVNGSAAHASYVSGSSTNALTFRYTVASGQNDSNGIGVATSVQLNGGSIVDSASHSAILSFESVNSAGLLIDTGVPEIILMDVPANGTYVQGQNIDFEVEWSRIVNVVGVPRMALTVGGSSVYANYASGSGTTVWTFRYTVGSGLYDNDGISLNSNLDLNGGEIFDAVGNDATLSFSVPSLTNVRVDSVTPYVVSSTPPSNATYVPTQHLSFSVGFNEAVTVTGTPRLQMTIGASTVYANYLSGSASSTLVFRYTVTSSDLDTNGIAVSASIDLNGGTIKDAALNNTSPLTLTSMDTNLVLVDGVAPSPSFTSPATATSNPAVTLAGLCDGLGAAGTDVPTIEASAPSTATLGTITNNCSSNNTYSITATLNDKGSHQFTLTFKDTVNNSTQLTPTVILSSMYFPVTQADGGAVTRLYMAHFNGVSWSASGTNRDASSEGATGGVLTPRSAIAKNGKVHIIFKQSYASIGCRGGASLSRLWYRTTSDNVTYRTPATIDNVCSQPSNITALSAQDIFVDDAGSAHILWTETVSGLNLLYYTKIASNGAVALTPRLVNSFISAASGVVSNKVVVDGSGNPHIVFANAAADTLYYTYSTNGGSSFQFNTVGGYVINDQAGGWAWTNPFSYLTLRVTTSGVAHVFFNQTKSAAEWVHVVCSSGTCTPPASVWDSTYVYGHFDLNLTTGHAWSIGSDGAPSTPTMKSKTYVGGLGWGTASGKINTEGETLAQSINIFLDGANVPRISYYAGTSFYCVKHNGVTFNPPVRCSDSGAENNALMTGRFFVMDAVNNRMHFIYPSGSPRQWYVRVEQSNGSYGTATQVSSQATGSGGPAIQWWGGF